MTEDYWVGLGLIGNSIVQLYQINPPGLFVQTDAINHQADFKNYE